MNQLMKPNEEERQLLDIPLNIIQKSNGDFALALRKEITINHENKELIEKLILASLKNQETFVRVRVLFNDKLKAILKLREIGFDFEKKVF